MKQILIISKYFAPLNGIASIRWSKIVKYLANKTDYHITVVTWALKSEDVKDGILEKEYETIGRRVDLIYIEHIYDTVSTRFVNAYHDKLKKNNSYENHKMIAYMPYKSASVKNKIKMNLKYSRYLSHENRFASLAYNKLIGMGYKPDIVISSYGDFGDHILALKLKKRFPYIHLIADYRDPAIRYFFPPRINRFAKKMVLEVATSSDYIIGVTKECIDKHPYPNKNVIIPNGFDRSDNIGLENVSSNNDGKFHICLTGTVYTGRRDHFHVLFDALNQLTKEGKIDINDFVFEYAGRFSWYVSDIVKKLKVDDIVVDHGYVKREEALRIQHNSQILMVLSCNNEGESGVLTGKFLEYMMSGKEILALISGNKSRSIIKEIVEEGSLGFCYEECTHDLDFKRLCDFILDCYNEFKSKGYLESKSKKEVIDRYDYQNIAKEVDNLIKQL